MKLSNEDSKKICGLLSRRISGKGPKRPKTTQQTELRGQKRPGLLGFIVQGAELKGLVRISKFKGALLNLKTLVKPYTPLTRARNPEP